jgi:hypothetical protein
MTINAPEKERAIMLEWLKSFINTVEIQNRVGLSNAEIKLLKKDFSDLDKKICGISERILRYLLDDEEDDVLQQLSAISDAGTILKLSCMGGGYISVLAMLEKTSPRIKFFQTTTCQNAGFWYRLAQVYDTASQTGPRYLICYGLKNGCEWL